MADTEAQKIVETSIEEKKTEEKEKLAEKIEEAKAEENGKKAENGDTKEPEEKEEDKEEPETEKCSVKRKSVGGDAVDGKTEESTPEKKAKLDEAPAEAESNGEVTEAEAAA